MNVTQTRSWVERELLNISREGDKFVATYTVTTNGDPLFSERWIGHASENGIAFTYDHCLSSTGGNSVNDESQSPQMKQNDERCQEQYERGTPMLTLSYKVGTSNQQLLITKFQKFEPTEHPENADGVEYFRKIQSVGQ